MSLRFLVAIALCSTNATTVAADNSCCSPSPADKMTVAATLKALACAPIKLDGNKNNKTIITSFLNGITQQEWNSAKQLVPSHVIQRSRSLSSTPRMSLSTPPTSNLQSPQSTPPSSVPQSPNLSPLTSPTPSPLRSPSVGAFNRPLKLGMHPLVPHLDLNQPL